MIDFSELPRATRGEFFHFTTIPTRWMDNDVYGHVNNVVYYSYFDTAVNAHLIHNAGLDIHRAAAFGVVAETRCRYLSPLSFPQQIDAALRVARLGRRSVTYDIALFPHGEERLAAVGRFVHVYVDRDSRRPVPVPAAIRAALAPLTAEEPSP